MNQFTLSGDDFTSSTRLVWARSRTVGTSHTMKKIVITYGLISGAVVAAMMFVSIPLWRSGILNFDNGEWVGYTTMVVAFTLIFIGIKTYRDKHANGVVTFWQGVKIGVLITAIASVCYGLSWEVSYNLLGDEFTGQMLDHYFEEMKTDGMSEAEIATKREEFKQFQESYKNPLIRFPVTLMEIFPVGLAITLLSAALLRRKEVLPATETIVTP